MKTFVADAVGEFCFLANLQIAAPSDGDARERAIKTCLANGVVLGADESTRIFFSFVDCTLYVVKLFVGFSAIGPRAFCRDPGRSARADSLRDHFLLLFFLFLTLKNLLDDRPLLELQEKVERRAERFWR